MGGSLLHLLAYFLGVLVDPTRWLISGLAGWSSVSIDDTGFFLTSETLIRWQTDSGSEEW